MNDYGIVLNAGSSSLKFSIYVRGQSAPWKIELRGQVDGIGTSPRLIVKDEGGVRVADEPLAGGIGLPGAFDAIAGWLRARYGGGARILGVGHRVVHGGATYAHPTIVTPEVMRDLR